MSTQLAKTKDAARIAVLDGYRALAILAVLAFHYTVRWAAPLDSPPHLPEGEILSSVTPLYYGWSGVELFFVVSGFVILMTLERCRSVWEFVIRRFARLWPPLVLAATATMIFIYLFGPVDWRVGWLDYLFSILILDPSYVAKAINKPGLTWVDGVYWSLFVEIRFYLCAALVYLFFGRVFVRAWIVLQIAVFIVYLAVPSGPLNAGLNLFLFPRFLPYFTLGICVYELYVDRGRRSLPIAGMLLAMGVLVVNILMGELNHPNCTTTGILLTHVVIFALAYAFAARLRFVDIFACRPLVLIGQASYSLYLIHQNIGVALMRSLLDLGLPFLVVLPATAVLMIFVSLAVFRYFEEPTKRWVLRNSKAMVATAEENWPLLKLSRKPAGG